MVEREGKNDHDEKKRRKARANVLSEPDWLPMAVEGLSQTQQAGERDGLTGGIFNRFEEVEID